VAIDDRAELIIQLPRGSSVDLHLQEEPPASIADSRVVLEHLPVDDDGKLLPPRAGEIILRVPSPEALRRERQAILDEVVAAAADGGPLVVLVEGAEYLRDNEIDAVLGAADATKRVLILRILEGV
jgi:hypothetical protein